MAGPRFLLVPGAGWVTPAQAVTSAHPRLSSPTRRPRGRADLTGEVAWRLIGSNNRELGRSAVAYPGLQECVGAIEAVQCSAVDAARVLSVHHQTGRWHWRLEAERLALAVSSRGYQRQRECLYNLQQFVVGVQTAEIPALEVDLGPAGACEFYRLPEDDEAPPRTVGGGAAVALVTARASGLAS